MLRNPVLAASGLTLFIALAACSGEQATPAAGAGIDASGRGTSSTQRTTISAELFYRERIALPPGAVAVATLEIGGSGTVVAQARQELTGRSIPVSVRLDIDQSRLPQDVVVVFRGSIEVDGRPAWQSEPRPVDLTLETIDLGSVMLRAVAEPGTSAFNTPEASALAGTWRVEDILGSGTIDDSNVTLDFSDQRVAGHASCNSYQGTWSVADGKLSIVDVAVTMMACPEDIMNQERRFLDALAATDGMHVDEMGALFLTSGGNELLRARKER